PLVGLDVGTSAVKVVQTQEIDGRKMVIHAAKADIEDAGNEDSIREAILSALKASEVRGKRVCCSTAGPSTAVRRLMLPRMAKDELPGAVWWEGGQVIPYDMEEVYHDFETIAVNEKASSLEVLFVAAPKELIDRKQKIVENCGLEVRVFDTDSTALLNGFMAGPSKPEGTTFAVIDIGAKYTNLAIGADGRVPFVRDILIGGEDYTREIMNALDVTRPEAERVKRRLRFQPNPDAELATVSVTERLAEEIMLSFQYYEKREERGEGARPEIVKICGGTSQLVGLKGRLSVLLDTKVESWNPLSETMEGGLGPGLQEYEHAFAVAVGLAMREEPM
ncbi:MAG: type IV pilus assembly protein PilM, partial [Candidatus Latescibacteria bacterium]|nr:type IV pilus assembly protein PilM [Candidatus Latescibacterota bacterium]